MQPPAKKYFFPLLLSLYGAGFAVLLAISWHRPSFFQVNIETFTAEQRTAVLYIFFGLFAVYALIAHAVRHMQTFPVRKAILLSAPFVLLLVCTPPLLSTDTAVYVANAKNFAKLHVSPYDNSPINASWPDEIGTIRWLQSGSAYGPLFHAVTLPFGMLPSASATASIFAYKVFIALLFLASIALMARLLEHAHAPPYFLALYALNPALLVNGIMEGHNDMLLLCFVLAFFLLFFRAKEMQSMFALGASVAVKYVTVVLLPVFFIERQTVKWRRFALALGIAAAVMIASAAVFGFPFSSIAGKLQTLNDRPCLFHCSPYVALTNAVAGAQAQTVRFVSFVAAYLWLLYRFLMKKYDPLKFAFWSLAALVFLYASWIAPWYLLVLLPLALVLAGNRNYAIAFWTLTAYSLLSYF